ncbi:MAG: hypothetical protein V3T08_09455 [Gemmatimonadota bacterium]
MRIEYIGGPLDGEVQELQRGPEIKTHIHGSPEPGRPSEKFLERVGVYVLERLDDGTRCYLWDGER